MNNSNNQTIQSENPKFTKANLKISEVAQALHMDPQTVRLMLRQGIVSWGAHISGHLRVANFPTLFHQSDFLRKPV